MERVDGFLSNRVQQVYPDAIVICESEGSPDEEFILRRPGKSEMSLGYTFPSARSAADSIVRAERAAMQTKREKEEKV